MENKEQFTPEEIETIRLLRKEERRLRITGHEIPQMSDRELLDGYRKTTEMLKARFPEKFR